MTPGREPTDPDRMTTSSRPTDSAMGGFALVSGVSGLAAGGFLIGFFTLASSGVTLAGVSLGHINDVLGAVQFATLAPVAWVLASRLPDSRVVRVATVVAVAAMAAFTVLSVLLVAGALTFAQQIGPVMVTIVAIYLWLLGINLLAHRTRTLPRTVTRTGVLLGVGLLAALALVAAGYVLPGAVGQLATWLGWGLGGISWLGLPVYVLAVAAKVLRREAPTGPAPADHDGVPEAIRS